MERTMVYTIEEERVVKSDETIIEIAPYGGNRVNKQYPKLIEKMARENDNLKAHFPLEPFHYREVKRHGTELAMSACVENNIPMSMETQKEVPYWALELLTRHKMSEIRIGMNTFNEKKWKAQYPMASKPTTLRDSFIESFNCGIYTILTISPVVAGVTGSHDIFEVADCFKYWAKGVEISPKEFDIAEFKEARELYLSKKLGDIHRWYVRSGDKYVVEPDYWALLTHKLNDFLSGSKLSLIVK